MKETFKSQLSNDLRLNLIRLAYANPTMRKDLLPLIQHDKSASGRMEIFEEIEGFVDRLRKHPDWKKVLNDMNDSVGILGEGEPLNAMMEAQRQVVLAKAILDRAFEILHKW